ncbi:MAG: preprotein translocase subunit YajC [Oscillospiraceae bacterium]|nr:preprotein translocase subunit YajC [Oscillospiraceae bacterium]
MSSVLMIAIMIAVFYFMLIRPENKRKKQATEMRNSLTIGDEVTTIGGIVGTVCAVKANSIVVETGADRVRIELMKWAISSKGVQVAEDEAASESQKAAEAKKKK